MYLCLRSAAEKSIWLLACKTVGRVQCQSSVASVSSALGAVNSSRRLQFEADPDAYGVRRMTRSVSAVSAAPSCDGSEATDATTVTTASVEDGGDDRFPEVRADLCCRLQSTLHVPRHDPARIAVAGFRKGNKKMMVLLHGSLSYLAFCPEHFR